MRCRTAALIIAFASLAAHAQRAPGGISADAIPIEEEPQHVIRLTNDFVRVIDATLPPGYVTKDHIHVADSVSVQVANGRSGEDGLRIGRAAFSSGGYSHVVPNNNPEILRYIVVEPIRADHPGAPAAVLRGHTLEDENDRVRIYRVRLDAGASMERHSHATGWAEVTVFGPEGTGNFAWIGGGENNALRAPADGPLEIVEIEPK